MRALVTAYADAVEANHLELAMTHVHDDSPHRQRLETELDDQLSWCFQRAETLSFGPRRSKKIPSPHRSYNG